MMGELQEWIEAFLPLLPPADLLDEDTLNALHKRLVVDRDFMHPDPQLDRLSVLREVRELILYKLNREAYEAADDAHRELADALGFGLGIDVYLANHDDRAQHPIPEPLDNLAEALLHVEMIEAIMNEISSDGLLLLFVNNFGSRLTRWRADLRRHDPPLAQIYDEAYNLVFDKLQKAGDERETSATARILDLESVIAPELDQRLCALYERMEDIRYASYIAAACHYRDALGACRPIRHEKPKPLEDIVSPEKSEQLPAPDRNQIRDQITEIIGRIASIQFIHPDCPAGAIPAALQRGIIAASALGDFARARSLIARIHRALAYNDKDAILWDIAVREASAWAAEGRLTEALAGLEFWRGSSVAAEGRLESRMSGVCISGGAYRAAMNYLELAEKASGSNFMRIDKALLQARQGSLQVAEKVLADQDHETLTDNIKRFIPFIQGVIASRSNEDTALALLTTATAELIAGAESSPASWSVFGICCSWWAVALHRGGRKTDAKQLINLISPLLINRFDRPLIVALAEQGLLPANTPMSTAPLNLPENQLVEISAPETTRHGPFETVSVLGVNALSALEHYRRRFAEGSGLYPFIIGDSKDLTDLKKMINPPLDRGASYIDQARAIDVSAWRKENGLKANIRWPKDPVLPTKTLSSLYDPYGALKPEIHIGLIKLDDPSEVFARLGFGAWNDCPPPHIHMALHSYWRKQFGAEPVAISGSVVECRVGKPCEEKTDALRLAGEQYAYCYDIVEQGIGTKGKLAASLLGSKYWHFWWD